MNFWGAIHKGNLKGHGGQETNIKGKQQKIARNEKINKRQNGKLRAMQRETRETSKELIENNWNFEEVKETK